MTTCKDCLHFEVCLTYTDPDESFDDVGGCQLYKSKNDFVPVVRCCECIHRTEEEPGMIYCPAVIGGWVSNDFYCGDGERKEGAD